MIISQPSWNELVPPPARGASGGGTVYSLMKFGAREHMAELRTTGRLRMPTLDYFRGIEDNCFRGDPYETVAAFYQPDQIELRVGDIIIPSHEMAAPVRVTLDARGELHVFSLFALSDQSVRRALEGGPPVDERCLEFGDSAVLFTDAAEFLDRVMRAAEVAGVSVARSLVHYVDPSTHHGELSPFNKIEAYSWQSEYRIVVAPSGRDVAYLELGSLEDISLLVEAAEVNKSLKIGLKP